MTVLDTERSEDLAARLADPAGATPGGESMEGLCARIAPWLAQAADCDDAIIAVTHAAVVRAMLSQASRIPVAATLNSDVAPRSQAILSSDRGWRLQVPGG